MRIVKTTKRHRYIGFHVTLLGNTGPITDAELIQTLRQQTQSLFSKDSKELGLWLVRFNGTTGILKCKYQEKENAIQLLGSLKKIGLKHFTVTTYATSGTIRGLTHLQRKQKA